MERNFATVAHRTRRKHLCLVTLALLLPPVGIVLTNAMFGSGQRVFDTAHLVSELAGCFVALGVALLLVTRGRVDRDASHLLWVALSLAAMGTTDGVHGLVPMGYAWSWLRHVATLEGGVLLALVWVPSLREFARRRRGLPVLVTLAALCLGGIAWLEEAHLPAPWQDGTYTWGTKVVNALGGVGFLVGGAWFARRYLAEGHEDDLALTAYAALFGAAGLVFGFAWVWEPGWWWLHACRLLAYAVVLTVSWRMVFRSFAAIEASAQETERRVVLRTQELAESQARLHAITDNAPVAIAYVDADLVVRFANPTLESWCGLPAARIVGRPLAEVIGRDAFEERRRLLDQALSGCRVRFEGAPPHPTLGPRHSDSAYIPDVGPDGKVRGIYMFIIDVTDLKNAQLALAEAQQELRRHADALEQLVAERTASLRESVEELEGFSYSIAHDMRAPLRAMQGYAHLIGSEQPLDERGRDFVSRIGASAERMDQLIRDVLDYSRVVRHDIPVTNVEPTALLRDILASYPQFHASDVTVQLVPPLPAVHANPAALTQVFSNLLGNAVKFVAPGVPPHVVVRGEARFDDDGRWIRFWVEDNGIGMSPEESTRIFGMFQRLISASGYAGTGMGLAIVRKAVERMGGRLGVLSEPGHGSRFWFELRAPG